jgi:hypothetical protein
MRRPIPRAKTEAEAPASTEASFRERGRPMKAVSAEASSVSMIHDDDCGKTEMNVNGNALELKKI